MRARVLLAPAAMALLVLSCATLGDEGSEGLNLPTSGVGPFRKLADDEVLGIAPYVLDGAGAKYREPSALALDADPSSARVALYVTATQNIKGVIHTAIMRTHADDARSFYGTSLDPTDGDAPALVLDAGAAWEEGNLHSPSVLRVGGVIYLYYAAAGGIGVATSTDGLTFTKRATPVLATDAPLTWETTPPTQPSVAVFPSGVWHMFYAAANSIGEATSPDGLTWTRADANPATPAIDPVFSPLPFDVTTLAPDASPPFDSGQVADPYVSPRVTAAGRLQVRVLYTGYDTLPGAASRQSAIGFAARYGDSGPLVRNATPVYSVGLHEAAPTLFEWSVGTMLYVNQDSSTTPVYPSIAAAIAPVTVTLNMPKTYATSP